MNGSVHNLPTDIVEEAIDNAKLQYRTRNLKLVLSRSSACKRAVCYFFCREVHSTSVANHNGVAENDLGVALNTKNLSEQDCATEARVKDADEGLKGADGSYKDAVGRTVILPTESRICASIALSKLKFSTLDDEYLLGHTVKTKAGETHDSAQTYAPQ